MNISISLGLVLSVAFAAPCFAGAQDVSPELRARAIQTCEGDALRLCPEAIMDEGAAVSCMAGKRPQLTQSCRVVYDQVVRVLKR